MTQADKDLLLKDLCARLPYGVIVKDRNGVHKLTTGNTEFADLFTGKVNIFPYLRPMDDMTEEEEKEYAKIVVKSQDCSYDNNESATTIVNDWYLSKGFDVRGLIPKGLAIEAPKGMYNLEKK